MVLVRASQALEGGITAPSSALLRIELERLVMGLALELVVQLDVTLEILLRMIINHMLNSKHHMPNSACLAPKRP